MDRIGAHAPHRPDARGSRWSRKAWSLILPIVLLAGHVAGIPGQFFGGLPGDIFIAEAVPFVPGTISLAPARVEKVVTRFLWGYNDSLGPFMIRNGGPVPLRVHCSVVGLSQDLEGSPLFTQDTPENRNPWSVADLVSLYPVEFEIEPGEVRIVKGRLTIPRERAGGGYACVLFEASSVGRGDDGNVISTTCLGSLLLVTFPGFLRRTGVIGEVGFSDGEGDHQRDLIVIFRNTGNIHFPVGGQVIVKDLSGHIIRRYEFEKAIVLPGCLRRLRIRSPWLYLESDTYIMVISMRFNDEELTSWSKRFLVTSGERISWVRD